MMDFGFYMPVELFCGEFCVRDQADALVMGTHALLVTGRNSARCSGALEDVTTALTARNIRYTLFDCVTENPLASTCREGGALCRQTGADFVIGIGGGSALDAAKAVAAFAVCPDATEETIFSRNLPAGGMLPIAAIPTTAGTGSEVNPYAVLTLPGGEKKKTFRSIPGSYPKRAFVDPRYTASLSENYTVSTALDALAHAMESYLSPKSNDASELFALYAARNVWDVIFRNADGEGEKDAGGFTQQQRQRLSYAATAAGIAINRTGTGFPHPLGYSITLSDGVPHGRACGAFAGAYIEYNLRTECGRQKLTRLATELGTTPEIMAREIPQKAAVQLSLTASALEDHVARVENAGNYVNSPYVISPKEMREIYASLFLCE